MKASVLSILSLLIILLIGLSSCSTTKGLKEGQYLLTHNSILVPKNHKRIEKKEINTYIKQKPNKRFLNLFRFKLWVYQKADKKDKNTRFNRWLKNGVGEAPVIFDSIAMIESGENIHLYLKNLGYFNNKVEVHSEYHQEKNKVKAAYIIQPSDAYKIRSWKYDIADEQLASYVFRDTALSKIKKGKYYDVYKMDVERERITTKLNNNGYYRFTKENINYEIDSSLNSHELDITLKIANNLVPSTSNPGTFDEVRHSRYFINRVFVNPDYDPILSRNTTYDTLKLEVHQIKKDNPANYYNFLHKGKIRVNPKTISQSVFIEDHEPYNLKDVQQSYRRLSGISAFDYKSIVFTEVERDTIVEDSTDKFLRCKINLSRSQLMSYTIEAEGTNRGGDLGMGASLTYLNKNIFRGGELLRIRLKGGLEAQKVSGEETQQKQFLFFNTWEAGLEISVRFPKFLIPIKQEKFPKYFRPFTTLSLGIHFQQRPQYFRRIGTVSFGYNWSESDYKDHIFNPIELNLVKIDPTEEFARELEELEDERLKNQYSDHLTFGMRYTYTFNNQDIRKLKNFVFLRVNAETSGNLLYLIDKTFNAPKNSSGDYTLFNVTYSQYAKFDYDFRYYFVFNRVNMLVLRSIAGIGIPYGNTPKTLPFEKGFYLGGANSLRGWRFRSVGPGASSVSNDLLDKMGEILIAGNVEYRFPIYKSFKGAFFTDIGNVWLLEPDSTFPGGEFEVKDFVSEFAVNAGLGFRLDFNFFIFRVDAAFRIRDPALPPDERWVIRHTGISNIMWNFGIGYPF